MSDYPYRKRIRFDRECYSERGRPFFITICTYNNISLFNNSKYTDILHQTLTDGLLVVETELLAYCIMPNHIHFLIAPVDVNLIDILKRWKSYTTNIIHNNGHSGQLWQRSFYDHALRHDDGIADVMNYIVQNPVRKGLVNYWNDYPYSWFKG